ncbi:MAG: hypothetical protein A2Y77_04370 [Planctomycetes bacterium RBG_13_62_9]|nr:MAG: hypothetical protein A2Y77_04370 [Planctomycetes bacterium RBG_13_62_9]
MDLDGDGHLDILSGSWPGELFLFRGMPNRSFAAPEMIKDKDGEIINIGGGIRDRSAGEGILIAGSARWETADGKRFANYRGKRYESTAERPIGITGTASVAHAVDWDGDGDYDLIVGDIQGNVHLIANEGTSKSYAFARGRQLQVDGQPLRVASRAGPCAADWDGDGDPDLLVGADDGSVLLFCNVGSAKSPELASAVQLVPPGEALYGPQAPKEPRRGIRSKICVADWNGDGRPDLLVGDLAYQKPDRPEPTAAEKAEHERMRRILEPVTNRYHDVTQSLYGPSRVRDKEERDKLSEERRQLIGQMEALESKLPSEYETHGWVWLFLRQ